MITLEYEGKIYIRPIGRGVCLWDIPGEPHFEDWLENRLPVGMRSSGAYAQARIVVELTNIEESVPFLRPHLW